MLSLKGILTLLNDRQYKYPAIITTWRDIYYHMSIHVSGITPSFRIGNRQILPIKYGCAEHDRIYDTFILTRYPNESEITHNWRKSQVKPYTQDPFQRAIDMVRGALFQDSNYSITINDKDDNEYINGNNFHDKTLVGYISENLSNIVEDPNGMFVVIPAEAGTATTTPDIRPIIHFICSKDIITISNDEVIFRLNNYAWVINNIGYFRFVQNEKDEYENADATGYYAHMLGYCPFVFAGGIKNNGGFYESWFRAGLGIADDFIGTKSNSQLVNAAASHPFISMAQEECPQCRGTGQIEWLNPKTECYDKIKCDECRGRGFLAHDPAEIFYVPKEDMDKEYVKITNPDVAVNTFNSDECDKQMLCLQKALHLNYIDEAQSAIAKAKDMQIRYQFITNICNDVFDRLIYKLISYILQIRNVTFSDGMIDFNSSDMVIIKPNDFDIESAEDLLTEISNSDGLPDYVKTKQLLDYSDKRFGGDTVMIKKVSIINQMDRLSVTSKADRVILLETGSCSKRQCQFSTSLPIILDEIIRNKGNEWFLNATYDTIKTEVDTLFALEPDAPEIVKTVAENPPANKISITA